MSQLKRSAQKHALAVIAMLLSTGVGNLSAQCTCTSEPCEPLYHSGTVIAEDSVMEFDVDYNEGLGKWELIYPQIWNTAYVRRFADLDHLETPILVTSEVGEFHPINVNISAGYVALNGQTSLAVLGRTIDVETDLSLLHGLLHPSVCDWAYPIHRLVRDTVNNMLVYGTPSKYYVILKPDNNWFTSCAPDKILLDLGNEEPGYSGYGRTDFEKISGNWNLSYEMGDKYITTLRIASYDDNLDMITSRTITKSLASDNLTPGHRIGHDISSNAHSVGLVYGKSGAIVVEKLVGHMAWHGEICGGGYNPSLALAGSNNNVYVTFTSGHKIYLSVNGSDPKIVAGGYYSRVHADSVGNVYLFYSTFASGLSGYKIVGTKIHSHTKPTNDEYAGALNVPCGFQLVRDALTGEATISADPVPPPFVGSKDLWYNITPSYEPAWTSHFLEVSFQDNSTEPYNPQARTSYIMVYEHNGNLNSKKFLGGAIERYSDGRLFVSRRIIQGKSYLVRIGTNSTSPQQSLKISCFNKLQ